MRIALRRWVWARNYKIPIRFIHAALITGAIALYAQLWFWYASAIITIASRYKPEETASDSLRNTLGDMPVAFAALIALTILLYTYAFYIASTLVIAIPYAVAMRIMNIGVASRRSKAVVARQTVLIGRVAAVVISADRVSRLGSKNHARNMNRLFRDVRSLKRQIARQHQSAYVPLFSSRARRLRSHQRIVIAALTKAESELDCSPQAINEIVEISLEITENYTRGLYGALLAPERLEGIEPARDWEPIRLALAALVIAAAAVAVSFFDMPDPAITALMGATGIVAITLLYGRGARSALDIVDTVRG
ncbi:hypothetical protein [Streptomyces sp. NPDC055794]